MGEFPCNLTGPVAAVVVALVAAIEPVTATRWTGYGNPAGSGRL